MSTKTSKKDKWDEPTGPLTEDEMANWSRMIQIRKMIEGRVIGDTSERAWKELAAYKSTRRIIVDVTDVGLLYNFQDSRQLISTTFPLVPMGFTLKPGMRFVIFAADITTKEDKKCGSTSRASSRTPRKSRKHTKPSRRGAGTSRTTGRRKTRAT